MKAIELLEKGNSAHDKSDYNEAIKFYDEAIKADENCWQAYNNRGLARYEIYHYQAALLDFEAALKFQPRIQQIKENRELVTSKLTRRK